MPSDGAQLSSTRVSQIDRPNFRQTRASSFLKWGGIVIPWVLLHRDHFESLGLRRWELDVLRTRRYGCIYRGLMNMQPYRSAPQLSWFGERLLRYAFGHFSACFSLGGLLSYEVVCCSTMARLAGSSTDCVLRNCRALLATEQCSYSRFDGHQNPSALVDRQSYASPRISAPCHYVDDWLT